MTDNRVAIRDEAVKASMNRLRKHSVGIINSIRKIGTIRHLNRRGDGEGFGTGCASRWGRHRFVLTAAHVFEEANASDLRLFWCPGGDLGPRNSFVPKRDEVLDGTPLESASAVIHRCGWEDLAVVVIDDNVPTAHTEFFDIHEDWIDPENDERVHSFGFPSDSAIPWERTMMGKRKSTRWQ